MPDFLHVKHLGSDSDFYGSVLELLVEHIMPGTRSDNLIQVWGEIKIQYRLLGTSCQFTNMKESMFRKANEFPKLKGRAAEIRHLGRPLWHVFQAHMDNAQEVHRWVSLGLKYSVALEEILDAHPAASCLPADSGADFLETIYKFLAVLTALSTHCHGRGQLLFHFTIKNHFLLHVGMYCQYMSPRACWNYSGEDFMQRVRRIVGSCQRGTAPPLVCTKVMDKYIQGLGFVLLGDNWDSGVV